LPRKLSPLLCELHAHTTWSDGALSLRELVDLYGRSGFDVLAVTDHTVRAPRDCPTVRLDNYADYLVAVEVEAERARRLYDLLVLAGLELTYDDPDPVLAAHALAVGLRSFVGVEAGLEQALRRAREAGAALIAAHPYSFERVGSSPRGTARFAESWRELAPSVDRFELFNRHELFGWVAEARLPAVATGDFHRREHLATWKTLLPCAKHEAAVVEYLRSGRPTYLAHLPAVPFVEIAA
jgi:DNA polymerase III alpha subunit